MSEEFREFPAWLKEPDIFGNIKMRPQTVTVRRSSIVAVRATEGPRKRKESILVLTSGDHLLVEATYEAVLDWLVGVDSSIQRIKETKKRAAEARSAPDL